MKHNEKTNPVMFQMFSLYQEPPYAPLFKMYALYYTDIVKYSIKSFYKTILKNDFFRC